MNANPPRNEHPANIAPPVAAIGAQWAALCEAANVVAALAGAEAVSGCDQSDRFAALHRRGEAWRRVRAERGIADIGAMMEPGIAALLAISARGVDPAPAAGALWDEFLAARAALLALLPPERRSAEHGSD
ncbi:conserved hypothetical protein [Altererythrobacter sp. B11]|uniref:hypothetical protein n=1 Tax=Altererythrobacter sp. B11 TaxID=2060312 RepID=UPI000DC6E910|nr:hypothetical protein [Altererythrobacter sp. B11]BBC71525.1 conserved hypothetical protein [Altererythrobacter sp. B11]